jgi:predicted membrane-bound dolichyl-phosphate-mannose-protein mannosyltransferase
MLHYKQDLIQIGSYTLKQIDRPYNSSDSWEQSVQNVHQHLRNEMKQRNRIMIMVYGYYLGELIQSSITPRDKWQEFVRNFKVSTEYYLYFGSTQIYKLFKDNSAQIYQTSTLSFCALFRMKIHDYEELIQCSQDLNELVNGINLS